jgi:hypothetical protein
VCILRMVGGRSRHAAASRPEKRPGEEPSVPLAARRVCQRSESSREHAHRTTRMPLKGLLEHPVSILFLSLFFYACA